MTKEIENILFEKLFSYRKNIFKDFKREKIIEIFDSFSKKDICNLDSYKLKDIKRKYIHEQCKKYNISIYATISKEYYILKGYTEEEAIEKINKRKAILKSPYKIETHLAKGYTEEEANNIVKLYRSTNKEHWIAKGYTEEEAIEKIKNIQKDISNKRIEKYKNFPDKYASIFTSKKEYWLNKGYTEKEAILKVYERQQTFSLEKCIQKYGKRLGRKKWKERQIKWQKSLNENFNNNGDGRNAQSKWAVNCINEICNELNINVPNKEKYIIKF